MGTPMDLSNVFMIPTWGLVALGISLFGTLVAAAIGFWFRRAPVWTLALVPLAGAAAWAASTAPTNMVTLSVGLVSVGLAMAQIITGALGLAPAETGND